MTQSKELNLIIQAKEGKQYRNLMKFPCGLRQRSYNSAYKKAQDTMHILEEHGLKCRLIKKYLKTYMPNTVNQLQIIGV